MLYQKQAIAFASLPMSLAMAYKDNRISEEIDFILQGQVLVYQSYQH